MRPLELTIEGFKSHLDQHTFSFDGRTLFGIVGPIGAGKSSILEAIIFALYGKTPKHERDTKKLVNSRAEDARVHMLFDVDDRSWEVTRVLRRKGTAEIVLRRFKESSVEAAGERAVNARIEELLGLEFRAFCSSVVLPQGEFDRFLKATPGERSKILKGIFRLERVDLLREASKARESELKGRIQSFAAEREGLRADPDLLEQLRTDLAGAEARAAATREGVAEAGKIEAEIAGAKESITEIDRRIEEAAAKLDGLPDAATLEKLAENQDRLRQALEDAAKAAVKARDELARIEAGLAEVAEEVGTDEGLRGARDLARDRARTLAELEGLEEEEGSLKESVAGAEGLLAKRSAEFEGASAALAGAETKLAELRHHHAAHLLRKEVVANASCPVCNQLVGKPPAAGRAPGLKPGEEAVLKAKTKAEATRSSVEEARRGLSLASERLAAAKARAEEKAGEAARLDRELTELVGAVPDPLAEVESRLLRLDKARALVDGARKSVAEIETVERRAEESMGEATELRRRFAADLIGVCGWLHIPAPDIGSEVTELIDASKRAADAAAAMIEADRRRRVEVEKSAEGAERALDEIRERLGLAPGSSITGSLEEANTRIGALRAEITAVEKAIQRATQIDAESEALLGRKDIYSRLSADLTDNRFIAYLLDGRRRLLSRIGSEKLFELTGRYRFDDEGEFAIVDDRSDAVRTADTLSGGETFLASLALALALAEAVTQEGGRLGCFFLDEGFGSLDPESLDLALVGIENLATPERLIGLISHVSGIQTLDDLIVLEKGADGSTNVVQTEGPISYPGATI